MRLSRSLRRRYVRPFSRPSYTPIERSTMYYTPIEGFDKVGDVVELLSKGPSAIQQLSDSQLDLAISTAEGAAKMRVPLADKALAMLKDERKRRRGASGYLVPALVVGGVAAGAFFLWKKK